MATDSIDFLRIEAELVQRLNHTEQTLSRASITSLPYELFREILVTQIPLDRNTHGETIRLSSVSSLWRHVITNEKHLFTSAKWCEWPEWLLHEWCMRADDLPLHIALQVDPSRHSVILIAEKLSSSPSLSTAIANCKWLDISYPHDAKEPSPNAFMGHVFQHSFPVLQFLKAEVLHTPHHFGVLMLNILAPLLEEVEMTDVVFTIVSPQAISCARRVYINFRAHTNDRIDEAVTDLLVSCRAEELDIQGEAANLLSNVCLHDTCTSNLRCLQISEVGCCRPGWWAKLRGSLLLSVTDLTLEFSDDENISVEKLQSIVSDDYLFMPV